MNPKINSNIYLYMRLDLAYVIGLIIFIFFCYLATYRTIERFTMKSQKDFINSEYKYYKKRKEDMEKQRSMAIKFPSGFRINIKQPPPIPELKPSTTPKVSAEATAASTAFPPFSNAFFAALVANG